MLCGDISRSKVKYYLRFDLICGNGIQRDLDEAAGQKMYNIKSSFYSDYNIGLQSMILTCQIKHRLMSRTHNKVTILISLFVKANVIEGSYLSARLLDTPCRSNIEAVPYTTCKVK